MSAAPRAESTRTCVSIGDEPRRCRGDDGYVTHVPMPVVLAVGVLIIVVAVLAIRLASGAPVDETKPRALILGDSITDHGQRDLRDTLGPVYELSVEGQDNFRVDDLLPVAQRWATRDFQQVVINLGTNDAVQGWPLEQTTSGMTKLVAMFPDANCIHLTTVKERLKARSGGTSDAAGLNDAIRELAESNPRVRVVDWNAIEADHYERGIELTSDGAHPTADGQQLLVDAYEKSMGSCSGT